jgi:hypothetical protein
MSRWACTTTAAIRLYYKLLNHMSNYHSLRYYTMTLLLQCFHTYRAFNAIFLNLNRTSIPLEHRNVDKKFRILTSQNTAQRNGSLTGVTKLKHFINSYVKKLIRFLSKTIIHRVNGLVSNVASPWLLRTAKTDIVRSYHGPRVIYITTNIDKCSSTYN